MIFFPKVHCELKKQLWHIEGGARPLQVPYLYNYRDCRYSRWHCSINIKGFHQECDAGFLVREGLIIQTPQKRQFSGKWMKCKKVLHLRASDPIRHICSKINILGLWQVSEKNGYVRGLPTRGGRADGNALVPGTAWVSREGKDTWLSFTRKWKTERWRKDRHKVVNTKFCWIKIICGVIYINRF